MGSNINTVEELQPAKVEAPPLVTEWMLELDQEIRFGNLDPETETHKQGFYKVLARKQMQEYAEYKLGLGEYPQTEETKRNVKCAEKYGFDGREVHYFLCGLGAYRAQVLPSLSKVERFGILDELADAFDPKLVVAAGDYWQAMDFDLMIDTDLSDL